jgi:hypothetical protein
MTARLRCTSCLDRLSYERSARERERATDPLQHAIESILPWVRGQRGLYSRG